MDETSRDTATITVEDPDSGRRAVFRTPAEAGLNRAWWDMEFEPGEAEVALYRDRLAEVAEHLAGRLEDMDRGNGAGPGLEARGRTDRPVPLDLMVDDLLEPQSSPSPFDGVEYPTDDPATDGPGKGGGSDDLRILETHLAAVRDSLPTAGGWRALNGLRAHLEAFAPAAGDTAVLDLYPRPLTPREAPPGRYRVRVAVDGAEAAGWVRIREDPLKRR